MPSRLKLLIVLCLVLGVVPEGRTQEKYKDPELTPKQREHWAFQSIKRPTLPKPHPLPNGEKWGGTHPIDQFVLQCLQADNLTPSGEADRRTLIRRLALDLTGLPLSPDDVEAFLNDREGNAYERLVDRLLASPHFGERQAQLWLDVVRFAESNGFELDADRPHAWRYRDYVIESFNADKPYDQFIREQLAGDELAQGQSPRVAAPLWIATGMHRCGPVHMVSGNLDGAVLRQERLTEMVAGVSAAFVGLTVGCARCHDHKFDPISAGDYYRLQAFFGPVEYVDVDLSTDEQRLARKARAEELNTLIGPIKKQIQAIDSPYRAQLTQHKRMALEAHYRVALETPSEKRTLEQKKLVAETGPLLKVTWDEVLAALSANDRVKRAGLRARLHELEARMPAPNPAAWAIKTVGDAPQTFVLKRGDPHRKTAAVGMSVPRVLNGESQAFTTRLQLAEWLTDTKHPLTARVIVNRIWQSHFSRGIVATPNDFGTRGDRPTHPELLDWLATELIEKKWSLKEIHRLIVTSATYRQVSTTEQGAKLDPENRLLWRMNRKRLDAEVIRDSLMAVTGQLNRQLGGASVRVPLEPEVYDLIFTEDEPDGLWLVTPDPAQHTRRAIYLFNKRNVRLPLFEAFDQPDTLNTCSVRPVSTFAPQALIMMNGPFVRKQALAFSQKLIQEFGGNSDATIAALFQRALGRPVQPEERRLAVDFLEEQRSLILPRLAFRLPWSFDQHAPSLAEVVARERALVELIVVLCNMHEFVYRP